MIVAKNLREKALFAGSYTKPACGEDVGVQSSQARGGNYE